ncbi:MAG: hypothetical protein GY861_15250, partial [bacterium]|nr:hypothetical protein [bacterium]
MFNKKLLVPHVRVYIEAKLTEAKKAFIDALRGQFGMSRADLYTQGALRLMEIKEDIHSRIFMQDYVLLYRTATRQITPTKRKGAKYTHMYVYKIEAIDESVCRLYYKDNDDIDDYAFKIWKCGRKKLHKTVLDEFPVPVGSV